MSDKRKLEDYLNSEVQMAEDHADVFGEHYYDTMDPDDFSYGHTIGYRDAMLNILANLPFLMGKNQDKPS